MNEEMVDPLDAPHPFCPDGVVDEVPFDEFEVWRENHRVHRDPGGVIPRCPRCYSTKVKVEEPYIRCMGCRYSEFLFDFTVARRYA